MPQNLLRWWLRFAVIGGLISCFKLQAQPAPRRVEVSRDLWISAVGKEREGNNGASPKLKLKGIQEFFLIDFDPAPFENQRVVRAQLHLHCESAENLGRVTVSSITQDWVEGQGNGYAKTPGASCYQWAKTDKETWGVEGTDITGVVLGQNSSVWSFGDASARDANDWVTIPIDPNVVQARLDGQSYGFFVIDDVGNEYSREGNTIHYRQFPNRFFSSRESSRSRAPYFTLWLEPQKGNVTSVAPQIMETPKAEAGKLPPSPQLNDSENTAPPIPCQSIFGEPLKALDFYAARGETIGFFMDTDAAELSVDTDADIQVSLFSARKVDGHVDPLVPVGFTETKTTSQAEKGGAFIELYIAKGAKKGRHEFTIRSGAQSMKMSVQVWNFTLADRLSFIPQMNCYGLPANELACYRLAQEHRTTLNCLRYGWTGKVDRDAVPKKRADGTWDWSAWDAKFGPLLDGSAFKGLPRAGIPLEAIYLPLNENWPMEQKKHFKGGYWIENAYDDAYWQEFHEIAAEFARHFADKKWDETLFEFYLNNKVYFKRDRGNRWDACSAPWIFDEPVNTQDFWALRRFGLEFWRGVNAHPGPRFTFRADISRPEWQRNLLDGVTSEEVVSGALRQYRKRVITRAEKYHNLVYMYGAANHIGTPNVMPAAWCVETWALGGDGVVPWQTMGKAGSWQKPDQLSLFYPTENGEVVPSIRLKSFRAGQQLVEYLNMYQALAHQTRSGLGKIVLKDAGLKATLEKKSEADAGTAHFGQSTVVALENLRMRLGTWLDAQAPEDRERWHDPRPPVRDAARQKEKTPLVSR